MRRRTGPRKPAARSWRPGNGRGWRGRKPRTSRTCSTCRRRPCRKPWREGTGHFSARHDAGRDRHHQGAIHMSTSSLMVFTGTDIAAFLGQQALEELKARKARVCTTEQLDAALDLVEGNVYDIQRWIDADALQVLIAWVFSHGRTTLSLKHFISEQRETAERLAAVSGDVADDEASQRVAERFAQGFPAGKAQHRRKPHT